VYYNFPLKAIYLKEVLFYSHPVAGWASDNFHLWNYSNPNSLDATLESYTELYIEFKYGFKFKSYLKQTDGKEYVNDGRLGVWRSLFFQFEVENAFARIKPQALFLNINDPDSAAASYGAEVLINLSDQIKFYTRFAMVAGSQNDLYRSEEGDRNWYTFAAELQFLKIFSNTEMFVSFGNFDHTNDDLVHDKNGGILNGRVMEKKLNFFIKFWM
jgi:hypothetical protein